RRRLPVAALGQTAFDDGRGVGRGKLADRVEDRARHRRIAEGEVVMERGPVDRAGDRRVAEQRLGLRREEEQPVTVPAVEGLLSQPIAREEQSALGVVPDGVRVNAGEALDALLAVDRVRDMYHL